MRGSGWSRHGSVYRRTEAERWKRWKQGKSISSISQALERRTKGGVQRIVSVHGGIAPSARLRAAWTLELGSARRSLAGLRQVLPSRAIARNLGRSQSTIFWEIARNGGAQAYRATRDDKQAWERARRPKRCRLACSGRLRWLVAQKLALQWSPEQVAGWLRREYPGDPCMRISHEAIYRSLFIQSRGVLRKELTGHLHQTANASRQGGVEPNRARTNS
ncbi:MAG: Integrase, catalytic region [Devosia sp.]|nr:Integrase, catalytic region [Devosia sp.]